MTVIYLLCFLLITVGAILLLGLTPERISEDLMRFAAPEQTLRDKVLTANGKKKTRKLTASLNRIRDALESTGKGNRFTIACAASLGLMIVGCVVAVAIDNLLLIPVFAVAFALIPFAFAKRTVNYYDNHVSDELETALSYLKPPVRDIFAGFVAENAMISANVKQSIKHLREKVKNTVFKEWCDTLIACQDDRTLKDTLMPVVAKLTDIRLANNEIKGLLFAARTEYFMMAGMVVANIPLLYVLNRDWYNALMYTALGKAVMAICACAILVTALLMLRYTKPIEYRK